MKCEYFLFSHVIQIQIKKYNCFEQSNKCVLIKTGIYKLSSIFVVFIKRNATGCITRKHKPIPSEVKYNVTHYFVLILRLMISCFSLWMLVLVNVCTRILLSMTFVISSYVFVMKKDATWNMLKKSTCSLCTRMEFPHGVKVCLCMWGLWCHPWIMLQGLTMEMWLKSNLSNNIN